MSRCATAEAVFYLDDDVLLEPWVIERLLETLHEQQCAFIGAFPVGLSYRDDIRPNQQLIEYWDDRVQPETLLPESPQWERWQLHRAANLYHVAQQLRQVSDGSIKLHGSPRVYSTIGLSCWR